MKITFLGTGTSQGVPVVSCKCEVCISENKKDKRLRTSILIEIDDKTIVVDTGPDFRQQMLRENVERLDAVLFTHEHKDHIAGLDDVRGFNFTQEKSMDIYATENVQNALKTEFHYAFAKNKYPGVPKINLHTIDSEAFQVDDTSILPIKVWHYKLPVMAFRIKDFTYITDANKIDYSELEKIKGTKILVVNALRKEKHISHFNLQEALDLIKIIQPEKAYLTHISHLMGLHNETTKELPENVFIAYDNLKITV